MGLPAGHLQGVSAVLPAVLRGWLAALLLANTALNSQQVLICPASYLPSPTLPARLPRSQSAEDEGPAWSLRQQKKPKAKRRQSDGGGGGGGSAKKKKKTRKG